MSPRELGDLRPGDTIGGRYRISRQLGAGSMGRIYVAEHRTLEGTFAVKVLNAELGREAQYMKRFLREAQAAAQIDHENVVRVLDMGRCKDQTPFFVMEHLSGRDLEERIEFEGTLDWRSALSLTIQVCRGLSAIHAQNIVHRDLKPANCMLVPRPDGGVRLAIIDFGIAHLTQREGTAITQAGAMIGTLAYMAPEQLQGRPPGPAIDIHAVGAIAYTMLTGHPPYRGSSMHEVIASIAHHPIAAIAQRVPGSDCPSEFESIIRWALSKDPSQRPSSARELCRALEAIETRLRPGRRAASQARRPWSSDTSTRTRTRPAIGAAHAHAHAATAKPQPAVKAPPPKTVPLGSQSPPVDWSGARETMPTASSRRTRPDEMRLQPRPSPVKARAEASPPAGKSARRPRWPLGLSPVQRGLALGFFASLILSAGAYVAWQSLSARHDPALHPAAAGTAASTPTDVGSQAPPRNALP